jgi:hypothetical protein
MVPLKPSLNFKYKDFYGYWLSTLPLEFFPLGFVPFESFHAPSNTTNFNIVSLKKNFIASYHARFSIIDPNIAS